MLSNRGQAHSGQCGALHNYRPWDNDAFCRPLSYTLNRSTCLSPASLCAPTDVHTAHSATEWWPCPHAACCNTQWYSKIQAHQAHVHPCRTHMHTPMPTHAYAHAHAQALAHTHEHNHIQPRTGTHRPDTDTLTAHSHRCAAHQDRKGLQVVQQACSFEGLACKHHVWQVQAEL